eukprot:236357_1
MTTLVDAFDENLQTWAIAKRYNDNQKVEFIPWDVKGLFTTFPFQMMQDVHDTSLSKCEPLGSKTLPFFDLRTGQECTELGIHSVHHADGIHVAHDIFLVIRSAEETPYKYIAIFKWNDKMFIQRKCLPISDKPCLKKIQTVDGSTLIRAQKGHYYSYAFRALDWMPSALSKEYVKCRVKPLVSGFCRLNHVHIPEDGILVDIAQYFQIM